MRTAIILVAPLLTVLGCDTGQDIAPGKQTKSVYDLKQKNKPEMSKEELEEARRKAGFRSPEEQMAEAKAKYEKEERAYIKGRLKGYREMVSGMRTKLDEIEKLAPKWASSKKGAAAFEKWNAAYKEDNKEFLKAYDDLTEKRTRGGNLQSDLAGVVTNWETFNGELAPKISEDPAFKTALEGIRKGIDDLEKVLAEIEKDDTLEPEQPADHAKTADVKATKGKKKK